MSYKQIRCPNCHNLIQMEEDAIHIRCQWCGKEYQLKQKTPQSEVRTIDYQGRGTVFKIYVPQGWSYGIFDDNESISSLAPVCKGLQLISQNGAQLVFYPFAFYKDADPRPAFNFGFSTHSASREYQFDPMTFTNYSKFMDLPQYAIRRITSTCKRLLQRPLANLQLQPVNFANAEKMTMYFQQVSAEKMKKPCMAFPGKFAFSFQADGQQYNGFFSTVLSHTENTSQGASWQDLLRKGVSVMGAMYGIGGMGTFDWGRYYDLMIMYPKTDSTEDSSYEAIFDNFLKNFNYGPVYFALQNEEIQNVQQIQLQGAMSRQQKAIRASQNISATLSETSNIVNSAVQSHSQQINHIIDHSTDGIRGVEYYHDNTGQTYQADVKYDHIYKKGSTFVGSSDGSLQLGPEWEELKK